ncbi:phage tail protein [Yersinia frederiksenii]|nr:phage tail protein [Yersinia frederiksenii]
MTTKFFAVLTNLGAAKLANATALGTQLQITQMAVGDGGGALPTPNPAQTQLIGEKRRAALNSLSIDAANSSQIIAEQVIPETEGGWWIREIGLLDKDGVLIAIANCPETYKPQLQEGSGRTQTVRMVLIVSSTDAVTLKIDPSVVLATRKYVDDQVIIVKAYADNLLVEHEKSRNHPDASLTAKGFAQYSSATNSDSETQAATSKAVNTTAKAAVTAMSDHVQTDNPHDQYLQIANLLSEIKAEGPQAVAQTLANLGLGEAAKRAVGTGANQVPDMNSFTSGNGWMRTPQGVIIQFGSALSNPAGYAVVNFPIPFTSYAIVTVTPVDGAVIPTSKYLVNTGPSTLNGFTLAAWHQATGLLTNVGCNWIAIGK